MSVLGVSRVTATVAGVATILSLTGCIGFGGHMWPQLPGSGTFDSEISDSSLNHADIAFVMMMIPHHAQAIEMVNAILREPDIDGDVAALAEQIRDTQTSEVRLMRSWLEDWGVGPGMRHELHGGTMFSGDMAELEAESGPQAVRLFLEAMIVHHQGGIQMAQRETEAGENAEVVALARTMIEDQSEEISIMKTLLDRI